MTVSTTASARPDLDAVAADRGMPRRDCRTCPKFESQGDGLGYGWCTAHLQFVKLYHPPGAFFSQCQFKALGRERAT